MGREYLFGVDIGTTGSKGVLLDPESGVIWNDYIEHGIETLRPGWVEQDPDECYWKDFNYLVESLFKSSNVKPSEIVGIGLSSLAPDMLPVDEDGEPIRPCIIYMDRRAEEECRWIEENIGREKTLEITGNAIDPYYAGYEIMWYKNNEPENYRNTWKILNADKYLVLKLTGNPVIDHPNGVIFAPLFDYGKKDWSEWMCSEIGIDMDKLPDTYGSSDVVGEVTEKAEEETGLASGTPVIAGAPDAMQSILSTGVTEVGDSAYSIGTTGCWGIIQEEPHFDPRLVNSINVDGEKYISVAGMVTTGAIVRWFRDEFGELEKWFGSSIDRDPYKILDMEAEEVPSGSDGLITLPYFMGERTPVWDPRAKGIFFGLTLDHTRAHLYRSILEGTAFGLKQHIDIARESGMKISNIKTVGGGAKSRLWNKIISDVTGEVLSYVPTAAGAPFGNAFLAGLGVGIYQDISEINNYISKEIEVTPDKEAHEKYSKLYEIYSKLYEKTMEESHKLHEIVK